MGLKCGSIEPPVLCALFFVMERTGSSTISIALAILLLVLGWANPARAWSNKEHIQLTRLAAERVIADPQTPAAMKDWLRAACPQLLCAAQEREYFLTQRIGLFPRGVEGLAFWATVPDMLA